MAVDKAIDRGASEDLAPWGYAPGSNLFHCMDCIGQRTCIDDALHKGHRHSTRCLPHALDARIRERRMAGSFEPIGPADDLLPPAEVLQAEEAASCRSKLLLLMILVGLIGLSIWHSIWQQF